MCKEEKCASTILYLHIFLVFGADSGCVVLKQMLLHLIFIVQAKCLLLTAAR